VSIELHSRTVRIGGPELAPGCGYRDILIHEVTESELEGLRALPWIAGAFSFTVGLLIGFGWAAFALRGV
jgi:hypothetical protein